ncbi:MAG: prenyltransferase [Methanomassiliicoccus sp.]|nr:prenyltransferase [Methanomassiliicoccus sp.]
MEQPVAYTSWGKIKEVLRIAYTLPFVLASVVGVAFALTVTDQYLLALLIPLDVLFLALFVNFSNDYFDHKSGVDSLRFSYYDDDPELREEIAKLFNQKVFWSGNSLDRGIITETQGRRLMVLLAIAAIIISIPIILLAGWIVVLLGLIALALAFFYTAPPVNLGARGLGEVNVFISFTMIAFFSYFVIVQEFSWPVLFVSLAIGGGAMVMRVSDEAPGYPSHVQKGEKNMLVRFGLHNIAKIETMMVVFIYACVLLAAFFEPFLVLLFLTLPLALRALRMLKIDDRIRLWRPIPQYLKMTVGLEVLAIIALIARTVWTSL